MSSASSPSASNSAAQPTSLVARYRLFLIASIGSLLLFAAQPPLAWSYLAWLAPLPWLRVATQRELDVKKPNLQIWFAGVVYWLLALHWIRLAHPATIFGLVLLAGILAVYLLAFVRLTRLGVLVLGLPLCIVAPVAWVACEWLQSHLFSGFLMAALSHTQINHPRLIQIADLGGAYMVSMLIVFVASCLLQIVESLQATKADGDSPQAVKPMQTTLVSAVLAFVAVGVSLGYGQMRIDELRPAGDTPTRRIAVVQGSERAVWTVDEGRDRRVMDNYMRISREIVRTEKPDLVVWPEGMFRTLLYTYDSNLAAPGVEDGSAAEMATYGPADLAASASQFRAPFLTGIDRYHVAADGEARLYNSAVAVAADGAITGTYDKTHRVMFGEYVPGGDLWPGLYNYFPIAGITPGGSPQAFDIDGVRYMPTICFETVVPHVVRGQVATLAVADRRPEVLVNITNDSWFYDSSELLMHLACSRYRALECRTPMVVAANGGLSAHIDRCGRVIQKSSPMSEQGLLLEVTPGAAKSFYVEYGDVLGMGCLLLTAIIAMMAILRLRQA